MRRRRRNRSCRFLKFAASILISSTRSKCVRSVRPGLANLRQFWRRRGRPEHESTSPLSAEAVSFEAPERALTHTGDAELVALVAEASRTHGNQLPYLPAFDPPCDSPPGISSPADLAGARKCIPPSAGGVRVGRFCDVQKLPHDRRKSSSRAGFFRLLQRRRDGPGHDRVICGAVLKPCLRVCWKVLETSESIVCEQMRVEGRSGQCGSQAPRMKRRSALQQQTRLAQRRSIELSYGLPWNREGSSRVHGCSNCSSRTLGDR